MAPTTDSAACSIHLCPEANGFRQDLDKDCRQHETCAKRYQVLKKPFTQPMGPGLDQKEAAHIVRPRRSNREEKVGQSTGSILMLINHLTNRTV